MINQQLSDYIKELLAQGTAKEKISESLLAAGWEKNDVEEALKSFSEEKPLTTPKASPLLTTTKASKAPAKMKAIIIMVLLGILVLGGGAFAYYRFLWMTPEKVMAKMMQNLKTVKTFEYSGQADVSFIPESKAVEFPAVNAITASVYQNTDEAKVKITFSGINDANNPDNQKGKFSIKINSEQKGEKISLGLETISLEKIIYLKITELPDLGFINLDSLQKEWIKIDIEALKKENSLIDMEIASSSVLEAKKEKLTALLNSKDFFQIGEEFDDEVIDGNDSYHYRLDISQENQYNFTVALLDALYEDGVDDSSKAEIRESLNKKNFPGLHLWVSKKDYLPTKISFANTSKDDAGKIIGKIDLSLFFKNYNQTVKVEAPESSKSFQEIFSEIFGSLMAEDADQVYWQDDEMFTEEPGQEGSIEAMFTDADTDGDGLSDQEEMFLGTDINKADTDDDGYPDGAEIEAGYNPLGEGKFMMPTE